MSNDTDAGEAQHWSGEEAYSDPHGYQLTRIADALERIAGAVAPTQMSGDEAARLRTAMSQAFNEGFRDHADHINAGNPYVKTTQ